MEVALFFEQDLPDEIRDGCNALINAAWPQHPHTSTPVMRVVATVAEGFVVGQQSIFALWSPNASMTIYGLGDLVVHRGYREQGIAKSLILAALRVVEDDTAVLTSTRIPHLQELFVSLGFVLLPEAAIQWGEGVPSSDHMYFRPADTVVLMPMELEGGRF